MTIREVGLSCLSCLLIEVYGLVHRLHRSLLIEQAKKIIQTRFQLMDHTSQPRSIGWQPLIQIFKLCLKEELKLGKRDEEVEYRKGLTIMGFDNK